MSTNTESFDKGQHPLDCVEEILTANNWSFNRMTENELMVQVGGKLCEYRLFFIWQEDMNALQFCCQFDMSVARDRLDEAGRVLMQLNENLWMGHFDIPADTGIPSFRHTCLMRGVTGLAGVEQIEDLVDISMVQCERYYSVFRLLSEGNTSRSPDMSLALMEIQGEA